MDTSGPPSTNSATSDAVGTSSADDGPAPPVSTGDATDGTSVETSASSGETGSSTGTGTSTGAATVCGDGFAEGLESCDGLDLGGMTCSDVGEYRDGGLGCDVSCEFDTNECIPLEVVEQCQTVALAIPDFASGTPGEASAVVTLPDKGLIANVVSKVTLTHTYIGDLSIDLQHDMSTVRLYDRACNSQQDIDLVFDDGGGAINCAASVSGADTAPSQPLSQFDGGTMAGNWTFTFQDHAPEDTGTVAEVCVTISY